MNKRRTIFDELSSIYHIGIDSEPINLKGGESIKQEKFGFMDLLKDFSGVLKESLKTTKEGIKGEIKQARQEAEYSFLEGLGIEIYPGNLRRLNPLQTTLDAIPMVYDSKSNFYVMKK